MLLRHWKNTNLFLFPFSNLPSLDFLWIFRGIRLLKLKLPKKKKRNISYFTRRRSVILARLDRDRESRREVWPCLSRQRREPEINKRARYLDGVFGIPAGPCRDGFHPKIFRRRNAYFDVVGRRRREKTNRQEVKTFPPPFPPPTLLDVCTHVSVRDVVRGEICRKFIRQPGEQGRTSLDELVHHSGLFFTRDKFRWLINLDFVILTNLYICNF